MTTALNTTQVAVAATARTAATSISNSFTGISSPILSSVSQTFGGVVSSVESSVKSVNTAINSIPTNVTRAMSTVGMTLSLALTAPLIYFGTKSTEIFTKFDDNMRRVQAATNTSLSQMPELTTFAQTVGKKQGYTPMETSQAMIVAAQAGLSQEEIKSQMPTILGTARSGNVDVTTATKLVSSAMTQYDMEGSKAAEHVGSVVAKVANESKTEMQYLADTYKYAGITASQIKVPFDELSSAIKTMADNGVYGRTAGTGLADMMLKTLNPTKAATEALQKYGLSVKDVNIEQRGLFPVIETLKSKNVSTGDLEKIFGIQGQRVASALTKGDTEELRKYSRELQTSDGYLEKMATTINAGAGGAVRTFTSNLQNLEIHLGSIVFKYIGPLLGSLDDLILKFLNLNPSTQDAIVKFAGFAAALGPALLIASRAIKTYQSLSMLISGPLVTAVTDALIAFGIFDTSALAPFLLTAGSVAVTVAGLGIIVLQVAEKTGVLKLAWQVISDTFTIFVNIVIPAVISAVKGLIKGFQDIGDGIAFLLNNADQLPVIGGFIDTLQTKVLGLADAWHQVAVNSETANGKQEASFIERMEANDHSQDKKQMSALQDYLLTEPPKSSGSSSQGKVLSLAESAARSNVSGPSASFAEAKEKHRLKYGDPEKEKATVDETVKYTVDSYGQLVKKVTKNVQNLTENEVAAYAETARAAGQAATFKVMSDGTVQASIEETTKVITTEAGKWAEAQKVAEEAGIRKISTTSKAANGEVSKSVNSTNTTIKNGIKTTVDIVTTNVLDMYGRVVSTIENVTNTIDDGINQIISKSESETGNRVNTITESSKDAFGNLKTVITDTQEIVKNGVKTLVETVTTNIVNMYGKLISSTKQVTNTLDDGINKIIKSSSAESTNQAKQNIENTVDAYGNIKQVITDTQETVKNGMSTITETITTNMFDANKNLQSSVRNVTQTMTDGVKTIKNTYNDITNAVIGTTTKTYKDASGDIITKSFKGGSSANAGNLAKLVSGLPSVPISSGSSVSTPIQQLSNLVSPTVSSASDLSSTLSSMNNLSFSKLLSNLNSVSKAFDSLNSKVKQFVTNMQTAQKYSFGTGSSKTSTAKRTEQTRKKVLGGI
jgi:TP901 family phage tail tape measure protein